MLFQSAPVVAVNAEGDPDCRDPQVTAFKSCPSRTLHNSDLSASLIPAEMYYLRAEKRVHGIATPFMESVVKRDSAGSCHSCSIQSHGRHKRTRRITAARYRMMHRLSRSISTSRGR